MMALRPVRSPGRAFLVGNSLDGCLLQGSHRSRWIEFVILAFLLLSAIPLWAQHDEHGQSSAQEAVSTDHEHHAATGDRAGWEGSVAGAAYSEFNHHLTGILVLIIGLSELRHALAMSLWAWTRFLLPGALLTSGFFLLVWSDYNAWPIGALSFDMDYAGLNAGVKVTLPVNEAGALLFLGDGHARQGEGEVVGTGIETSLDVEFSVQLIKKKAVGWPRLENETHIMVLGSARPLLQALQHATTEMQRWLVSDYGYSERAAASLMGQALEYEVANVVDPNFTMVAKVRKSLLARR